MITTRLCLTAALAALAVSGCQSGAGTESSSSPAATTSAAVATTGATTAAAKPAGDKVGAADLPAIVADRTYRGVDEGKAYAEYYAPDGSLRGKSGADPYTGSWQVVGEELCFSYPATDPRQGSGETDCYAVFTNGDAVNWVDRNGEVVEATYVEGNPDGL